LEHGQLAIVVQLEDLGRLALTLAMSLTKIEIHFDPHRHLP
jgi:hypothetical protein